MTKLLSAEDLAHTATYADNTLRLLSMLEIDALRLNHFIR
jgi:hypothetical protein